MNRLVIALIAGLLLLLIIICFILYMMFAGDGKHEDVQKKPAENPKLPGKPQKVTYTYKPTYPPSIVHSPIF